MESTGYTNFLVGDIGGTNARFVLKKVQNVIILNKTKTEVIATGNLIVGSSYIKNSKSGRIVKINDKK